MSREIIFTIVFMVFAYIIGKYKLLPYFAAKKILKDAKKDKQGSQDNVTATAAPSLLPHNPYAIPYSGYPVTLPYQQPETSRKRDMYLDCRLVATDVSVQDLGDAVQNAASDIFTTLRNRGICPNTFDIVCISDGFLLVYATYLL